MTLPFKPRGAVRNDTEMIRCGAAGALLDGAVRTVFDAANSQVTPASANFLFAWSGICNGIDRDRSRSAHRFPRNCPLSKNHKNHADLKSQEITSTMCGK
jgi:hypothetical protein